MSQLRKINPERREIGDRIGRPFGVFYGPEFYVAFVAQEAAHAILASFFMTAVAMSVVDSESTPLLVFLIDSTYRALSTLRRQFLVKPLLSDAVLIESSPIQALPVKFWVILLDPLVGLRMGIVLTILRRFYPRLGENRFSVFLVMSSLYSSEGFNVCSVVLAGDSVRAFKTGARDSVKTLLVLSKEIERLGLSALRTHFCRDGIDFFNRGHARSVRRVGFVRCFQHLTPPFYSNERTYA